MSIDGGALGIFKQSPVDAERARQPGIDSSQSTAPWLLGSGRIPSLDGLRALAILMVIVAHGIHSWHNGIWIDRFVLMFGNGTLGVSIFFVISGFLITGLLLREEHATGRISLRQFFVRRVFRILPAYYFYVLFVAVIWAAGVIQLGPKAYVAAVTFTWDYSFSFLETTRWILSHTWSLSVEEQFYIFWPAILVFCGRSRATILAIALVLLVPAVRMLQFKLMPSTRETMAFTAHTRADTLMFGCLAALLYDSKPVQRFCQIAWKLRAHWIGALVVLLVIPRLRTYWDSALVAGLSFSFESIVITLCLLWLVRKPLTRAGRVFNSPVPVFIGTLSYSLYLWHWPFITRYGLGRVSTFPLNVLMTVICACASYYCIERPFLKLRKRFVGSPAATPVQSDTLVPDGKPAGLPKFSDPQRGRVAA
jgi:peptidoglycan/LPS O-acetylase OafA/YrhL